MGKIKKIIKIAIIAIAITFTLIIMTYIYTNASGVFTNEWPSTPYEVSDITGTVSVNSITPK